VHLRDLFEFSIYHHVDIGNGETYAYRELKPEKESDKVILWLHATFCSSIQINTGHFLQQITSHNPNWRVLAPDFRGNGQTTYNKKINSFWDLAEDIKLFLDKLGVKKVVIIATCLGGMVSKLFSISYPEYVRSTIEIGALGISGGSHLFAKEPKFPTNVEEIKTTWFASTVNDFVSNKNPEGMKKFLDPFQKDTWVGSKYFELLLDDMMRTRNLHEVLLGEATTNISDKNNGFINGTSDVKRLKTDWLAIHGDNDLFIPFHEAEALKKELGDRCTLVILPKVGHFTWLDDMKGTMDPINSWLKKY